MVLIQSHPIFEQLQTARSYEDRNAALQALKNDTVGHVLKKRTWVERGVLRLVVRVLSTSSRAAADARQGRSRLETRGSRRSSFVTPADDLTQEDLTRLQALELLGIFGSGGPSFLAPLHAAGALPAILSCIDPHTTRPRLVYAALRTLTTIAKTALLVDPSACPPSPITLGTLADVVFANSHLAAFHNILCLSSRQWWAESTANLTAALITPLCREERHRIALVKAGILDDLTVKVASYVVARGQVVPGADVAAEKEGLRDSIPEPASPQMDIAAVMGAISSIMGDSRVRACMLLYTPSILAIFPQLNFDSAVDDVYAAWKALCLGGLSNVRDQPLGALDLLLPAIPSQQSRSYFALSSPFPPLGISLSRDSLATLGLGGSTGKRTGSSGHQPPLGLGSTARGMGAPWNPTSSEWEGADAESPMIPWLLNLVRSTDGDERLAAASVLTSLFKAGFSSRSREAAMALLVVPLLLQMLDDGVKATASSHDSSNLLASSDPANRDDSTLEERQAITESALTVLARLVANSDVLQKAAVDCNAIPILARLLKEAYEPAPSRSHTQPWNPTPTRTSSPALSSRSDEAASSDEATVRAAASSTLGPAGQDMVLAYRIWLRESALKAITALIASKYEHQKLFVEQEAMPYVVASLNPVPSKPRVTKEKAKTPKEAEAAGYEDEKVDPEYGRNTVGVLVAACNCVRMLSRSIAILRTTLEDAGVATPVFRLLRHPEIEVQIASTGVVCNLVTETSQMRGQYAEAGIMGILCNHAHSLNSPLRLNALWALKHFVDGIGSDMKKACLEQLGSGWLVQLIDPATEDETTLFARRSDKAAAAAAAAVASAAAAAAAGSSAIIDNEDVEMEQSDEDNDEDGDGIDDTDDASGGKMPWTVPTGTAAAAPSLYRAGASGNQARTSHERSRTGRLRQAEAKLAALREVELTLLRKSRSDDIVIQEQGLNFIRNLIGPGPGSGSGSGGSASDSVHEATEMIDYLFSEIGQDRLFQILQSKLKVKVLHPFERRGGNHGGSSGSGSGGSSSDGSRVLHPQAKIIEAVVFILVHISASVPRHRQLVIAQTELLKALVAQFTSRDKGVRVALCHLLTNLTWRDDAADTQAASARTLELKRLGLLTKLQVLQQEDMELDVREQAKMAIHQMGPQNV